MVLGDVALLLQTQAGKRLPGDGIWAETSRVPGRPGRGNSQRGRERKGRGEARLTPGVRDPWGRPGPAPRAHVSREVPPGLRLRPLEAGQHLGSHVPAAPPAGTPWMVGAVSACWERPAGAPEAQASAGSVSGSRLTSLRSTRTNARQSAPSSGGPEGCAA